MNTYILFFSLLFYTTASWGEDLKINSPTPTRWSESSEVSLLGLGRFNHKTNEDIKILISQVSMDMTKAMAYSDEELIKETSQGKKLTDQLMDYQNITTVNLKIKREKNHIVVLKTESYQDNNKSFTRVLKTYIANHNYLSSELIYPNDFSPETIQTALNDFASMNIYE